MSNIFEDKTKTLPKNDPRIVRVKFDENEIGARKSHISGVAPKNGNSIQHVKG